MRIWLSVALVTLGTSLMKASGPLALGERRLPPVALRMAALAAPVLLAALIVTDIGGERWADFEWTRLAGVGVAGVAHVLRAPLLVAVILGIVATALLRLPIG
jgi:branched-subunit amino acid transport protein